MTCVETVTRKNLRSGQLLIKLFEAEHFGSIEDSCHTAQINDCYNHIQGCHAGRQILYRQVLCPCYFSVRGINQ